MLDDRVSQCANRVRETCYWVMNTIQSGDLKSSPASLSIRQMMALMAIRDKQGIQLLALLKYLGGSFWGASQLVDNLAKLGYVDQEPSLQSNTCQSISLTQKGFQVLETFNFDEVVYLKETISTLTQNECTVVSLAMKILQEALSTSPWTCSACKHTYEGHLGMILCSDCHQRVCSLCAVDGKCPDCAGHHQSELIKQPTEKGVC